MNKKTVIIIIVALVLVIVAMGVGGFLFLSANKEKEEKVLFYSPGEYFVTNLKDSNSLLKVTVTLAYNKEGVEEELTANNAIIRNAIVFTLRSKTKQDMQAFRALGVCICVNNIEYQYQFSSCSEFFP